MRVLLDMCGNSWDDYHVARNKQRMDGRLGMYTWLVYEVLSRELIPTFENRDMLFTLGIMALNEVDDYTEEC
jgi:hypothetical protein